MSFYGRGIHEMSIISNLGALIKFPHTLGVKFFVDFHNFNPILQSIESFLKMQLIPHQCSQLLRTCNLDAIFFHYPQNFCNAQTPCTKQATFEKLSCKLSCVILSQFFLTKKTYIIYYSSNHEITWRMI